MCVFNFTEYLIIIQCMKIKTGDVETRKPVTTWTVGTGVNHQQLGNVWSGEEDIVSLSMSGDLNVFDRCVGDKPARVFNVSDAFPSHADLEFILIGVFSFTGSSKTNHSYRSTTIVDIDIPSRNSRWSDPLILYLGWWRCDDSRR